MHVHAPELGGDGPVDDVGGLVDAEAVVPLRVAVAEDVCLVFAG